MMRLSWAILLGYIIIPSLLEAAANKPMAGAQLNLSNSRTQSGTVSTDIELTMAPSDVQLNAFLVKGNQEIASRIKKQKVNLWLLVDTSSLCEFQGVDQYVSQLSQGLQSTIHPESLVSIVSYTNQSLEIIANHRTLSKLEEFNLTCESKQISASHEKALERLLKSEQNSGLPLAIWALSSGNVRMSQATLATLKKRQATLSLFLYNAFVEEDIRPIVEGYERFLGKSQFRFLLLDPKAKELRIPQQWYHMEFEPSYETMGEKVRFRVEAASGDRVVKSAPLLITIPKTKKGFFWDRYGTLILVALSLALFAYAFFRIVRFYRKKECPQCQRSLRYYDPYCLFCATESQAMLVGKFNYRSSKLREKNAIAFLSKPIIELGTHRKSLVRVLRPKKVRRACLARIVQQSEEGSKTAFKFTRTIAAPEVKVILNGRPLTGERFLSPGDQIQILETKMTFVNGHLSSISRNDKGDSPHAA